MAISSIVFTKKKSAPSSVSRKKSAMSDNSKMSTLSQDLIRRMMNTSEMLEQGERDRIIEKYIVKLEISGYSREKIRNTRLSASVKSLDFDLRLEDSDLRTPT